MSDTLILNELEVVNFRAFRHLQIKHLGRVNLVVGKNNVGKTCLLEALWLYASRGSSQTIQELLKMRNEFGEDGPPILATKYLLYGRENLDEVDDRLIRIGSYSAENSLFMNIASMDHVSIKTLINDAQSSNSGIVNQIAITVAEKGYGPEANQLFTTLRTKPGGKHDFVFAAKIGKKASLTSKVFKEIYSSIEHTIPHQFISARSLDKVDVTDLWDKIYLTDSQDEVEEALRIIEPDIKSVGLVDSPENKRQRVPQVRIPGAVNRVMLSSLGEGMERLFNLTLALVNAKNGFLLIDEIENGIHYTVQPKLWEFIFKTAHRLNVQVFATTHSWDAVQSFQDAAQEHKEAEGVLISLRNKEGSPGVVIGTIFGEEDLEVARHEHIEVR